MASSRDGCYYERGFGSIGCDLRVAGITRHRCGLLFYDCEEKKVIVRRDDLRSNVQSVQSNVASTTSAVSGEMRIGQRRSCGGGRKGCVKDETLRSAWRLSFRKRRSAPRTDSRVIGRAVASNGAYRTRSVGCGQLRERAPPYSRCGHRGTNARTSFRRSSFVGHDVTRQMVFPASEQVSGEFAQLPELTISGSLRRL